ncbi:DinB family protein [Hyphomicrobium sp.]|uniref:DinB family protein n=1 Tax=Hyphomicrobium sp. TaxID=82 RepID=UPI002D77E285|nr:DinB family protein [Hyphomicrobium sp.]HET6389690.1 DinB family protein [Hyphomicrobium sp.]
MILPSYVRTLARYNSWQNANIYGAAEGLSDQQRKEDRGAFFGSIHATLNHILWADQTWLHRLGPAAPPAKRTIAEGLSLHESWDDLKAERRRFDGLIQDWANHLQPSDLEGDLAWVSGATGRQLTRSRAFLTAHIFNHQTHHRGQVHALLTGFGVKPGVTDMPFGDDIYMG